MQRVAIVDLTQDRLKELLEYDPATGIFVWKVSTSNRVKIGDVAGSDHNKGYRHIRVDGKLYRAHRLAWLYVYGSFPPNQVDHINGIKDDNRIKNLRAATYQENSHNINKPATNTSGHLGVRWDRSTKKWRAQIQITGEGKTKKIHLGYFTDIADAVEARKKAELKYWGESSREYR